MTPPLKRLFPKEYSKELFRIARGDYESALIATKNVLDWCEPVIHN